MKSTNRYRYRFSTERHHYYMREDMVYVRMPLGLQDYSDRAIDQQAEVADDDIEVYDYLTK